MRIDANDPRWTAYALGELSDGREIAELDKALEESAEMRKLVEDIRETARLLRNELRAEPSFNLTEAQRQRIAFKANATRRWFAMSPAWLVAGTAAAVVIVSLVALRYFREASPGPEPTQMTLLVPEKSYPATRTTLQEGVPAETAPKPIQKQQTQEPEAAVLPQKQAQTIAPVPNPVASTESLQAEATSASSPAEAKTSSEAVAVKESAPPPQPVVQLPLMSTNATDLIKAMGGVVEAEGSVVSNVAQSFAGVSAASVNLQRDGITVNEVRYRAGLLAPSSQAVGGFRMIPSPVDAELGRGDGRELPPFQQQPGQFNTESYDHISDNPFLDVVQNPLSTFSIDVDTASYSNMRRFLDSGSLPPKDAIRIEELINYFDYDYKGPKGDKPFAVNFEVTEAPWKPEHRLLRIGIKGREIETGKRPNCNLVFLLDVSGSMMAENKLPLVKQSMRLLVDRLTEADRVAVVVYAGNTQVWLPSTSGDQKEKILRSIEALHAGGSTNGASGIQLAYKTANENFIKGGANRVILATDGDFNVGITNRGDLTRMIEEKAQSGIYLSALGFGMGNYKDGTLELLADKGRGNYAYIDTINEAKKVLVEQLDSTLVPIAKDVKIQVEFNPKQVNSYRLIGYENRIMAKEDFNDDTKKTGVIGAGHVVTALYELVPAGLGSSKPGVDPLKYQKPPQPSSSADSDELVTVKIRSKKPDDDRSVLSEFTVKDSNRKFSEASQDFKFAAAVAAFGMALRDSPYKGNANLERALEWAKEGKGADVHGYRQEFIRLVHKAIALVF